MIASLALSAMLLGAAPMADPGPARGAAILLVQDAPAPPAATRTRPRRPARRRAPRREPTPPVAEAPPLPPPAPQAEIAPMPNRSIEAPRAPFAPQTTQLRPDLIRPRNLPDSRVQSDNEYTRERDSLFREPAAGARMQIPFSY
ncbi:MAG TPA: hypothetical protein VIL69_21565 [Roseomonas sp.]|jgi:hypothetical protein